MNDMGIALELMGVGMVTVFLILSLVVILGTLIIKFVNRFIPEVQKISAQRGDVAKATIHPKKMAAIVSAVNMVTKGTGRVSKIEKL
ncbi:MAG TPA: OadG family transporter subunit [Prolixibacteraceae bacterium]|nr:OadG family transporter subunit [Prolixibacteraceae bacterium]